MPAAVLFVAIALTVTPASGPESGDGPVERDAWQVVSSNGGEIIVGY